MESDGWRFRKKITLIGFLFGLLRQFFFSGLAIGGAIALVRCHLVNTHSLEGVNVVWFLLVYLCIAAIAWVGFSAMLRERPYPASAGCTGYERTYQVYGEPYQNIIAAIVYIAVGMIIRSQLSDFPRPPFHVLYIPVLLTLGGFLLGAFGVLQLKIFKRDMADARTLTERRRLTPNILDFSQISISREIVDGIEPWIERHRREAWWPTTTHERGTPEDSKIGGIPCLAEGETWPTCSECGEKMILLLQLNSDQVPEEMVERIGIGLLQLFCCTHKDCPTYDMPRDAFSKGAYIRRIQKPQAVSKDCVALSEVSYPEPIIRDWIQFSDDPVIYEHEDRGLHFHHDREDKLEVLCPEVDLSIKPTVPVGVKSDYFIPIFNSLTECETDDKLGGNPYWLMPEYPECPECGTRMELLFQFSPQGKSPVVFDDVCRGYLMQCPEHRDVLSFQWQRQREVDEKAERNRRLSDEK